MPEPLHRLVYDVTIDEVVDVGLRMATRTHAFRRQMRQSILIAGIIGGGVFTVACISYLTEKGSFELALAALAGLAFGVFFAFLFRFSFRKEILKQQRRVVAEHLGGKPSVPCELELRPDALWVRQAGMEMIFPWTLCTGIRDNAEDIEMNFAPGICVVRNRHVSSAGERQRFLETARRLAGKEIPC
jgi:hypothetical protein